MQMTQCFGQGGENLWLNSKGLMEGICNGVCNCSFASSPSPDKEERRRVGVKRSVNGRCADEQGGVVADEVVFGKCVAEVYPSESVFGELDA